MHGGREENEMCKICREAEWGNGFLRGHPGVVKDNMSSRPVETTQ